MMLRTLSKKAASIASAFAMLAALAPIGAKAQGVPPQGWGAPPILSACGTSPSVNGNSLFGTVLVGTGAPTACTLTWAAYVNNPGQPLAIVAQARQNVPSCVITAFGLGGDIANGVTAMTTSALTVLFASSPASGFTYHCDGI